MNETNEYTLKNCFVPEGYFQQMIFGAIVFFEYLTRII